MPIERLSIVTASLVSNFLGLHEVFLQFLRLLESPSLGKGETLHGNSTDFSRIVAHLAAGSQFCDKSPPPHAFAADGGDDDRGLAASNRASREHRP
jgi:hypothetical protein